jgi:hypothetical protein
MKTLKQILTSLSLRGMAVGALLLGASVQTSQAGSADPSQGETFTWDLAATGFERGMAFITFTSDGNLHGYQMLAVTPPSSNSIATTVGRGGEGVGRNGGGGGAGQVSEIVFGFGPITGTWSLTSRGIIVGLLNQLVNVTSVQTNFLAGSNNVILVNSQTFETTNVSVVFAAGQATAIVSINWPNPPPGFTQDYTVDNPHVTTSIGTTEISDSASFTGTASGAKRLNLALSTGFGKINYRGVPAANSTTVDLSGNWVGSRMENNHKGNEFFSLFPVQADNPFPSDFPDIAEFQNLYFSTNGVSENTTFFGIAMVSQQKTVGFTFKDADGNLRAMIGPLKPTKFGTTAKTKGLEEPLNRLDFNATLQ